MLIHVFSNSVKLFFKTEDFGKMSMQINVSNDSVIRSGKEMD